MAFGLAVAGCLVAIVAAVQSYVRATPEERGQRPFKVLLVLLLFTQGTIAVLQYVNTALLQISEQKRLERETALALWAFSDKQTRALQELTKSYPYLLGYYQFKQGQYQEAAASFDEAIKTERFSAPARYVKAVMARIQDQDLSEARKEIEAALQYDPDYSVLYVEKAMQEIKGSQIEDAVNDLKKAVDLSIVHCFSIQKLTAGPTSLIAHSGFSALVRRCAPFVPTVAVAAPKEAAPPTPQP